MKTTSAFAAVLAVLLSVTPPAKAAAKTTKPFKMDAQAEKLMAQGLGHLQQGEDDAAITSFAHAARRQGSVSSYFLLGWAHYQRAFRGGTVESADRDDAQAAVSAYALATGMDPKLSALTDASQLYVSLGLCDEALENYDAAMTAYKAALKAAPKKAIIAAHAARLRLKMKDEQKAVTDLQMALDKASAAGREDELVSQIRRDPVFAPLLADAMTRRMLGAPSRRAVAALDVSGEEMRDAVTDAPSRPAPRPQDDAALDKIAQGDVELNFRRYQAAIGDFREALTLNQQSLALSSDQVASAYEKIGAAYNKLGQSDEAIRFLQKSLERDPSSANAHYQIALAYALSGLTMQSLHALTESFASASGTTELRKLVLLAKTDVELEAVRDLPGFASAIAGVSGRVALR